MVTKPFVRSVAFDYAIVDVVEQICAAAGTAPTRLEQVVIGVSYASLQPSHLRRRTPAGPYWRDVLTTALAFRLGARISVWPAIELAAAAERRFGAAVTATEFGMVHVDDSVEAALFRDGELCPGSFLAVGETDGDETARVCQAIAPMLKMSRPELLVVAGSAPPQRTRAGRVGALRLALLQAGVRRPLEVVPTRLVGEAVLVGAFEVEAGGRHAAPALLC